MPRRSPHTRPLVLALLAALLLPGCARILGVNQSAPRLFVLDAEPGAVASDASDLVLGLGPVDLPAYLDRQGIVTRVAPNRLETSRMDLWAEPIAGAFRGVLAQDLRLRLPGLTIRPLPWLPSTRPRLAVAVAVSRFEVVSASRSAELDATWSLRDPEQGTLLASREATIVQPVGGGGTEAEVATLGKAIGALADEIAAEVARRATVTSGRRRSG